MRRTLPLLAALALVACDPPPGITVRPAAGDRAAITVEQLFEHGGCVAYRVYGAGPDFFVRCPCSASVEWSEQQNKRRVTRSVETTP